MVISAKYASTCPKCSRTIAIGSKVEWSKGAKATHVDCGSAPALAPSVAKAVGGGVCRCGRRCNPGYTTCYQCSSARKVAVGGELRGRWTGCSCGSIEGQVRKSDCWTCRHDAE